MTSLDHNEVIIIIITSLIRGVIDLAHNLADRLGTLGSNTLGRRDTPQRVLNVPGVPTP